MFNIQKRAISSMCFLMLKFILLFDRLNVPAGYRGRLSADQDFLTNIEDELEEYARSLERMIKARWSPYRAFVKDVIRQELNEGTFFDDGVEPFLEKMDEVLIERWQVDQCVFDFIYDIAGEAMKKEAS